jgi:hypothetical protein
MVPGVLLFNLYFAITIKYIYNNTATMEHRKYFPYYIQGDFFFLDYINYLLHSDVLEVYVGWSVISIHVMTSPFQ